MTLTVVVWGTPQPQGSMRAFLPKGRARPIVTSDNPKNKPWRDQVALVALAGRPRGFVLWTGPVELQAVFHLPRPRRPRHAEPTARPDVDKLLRSCLDALTGVLWRDDSQVTSLSARKRYVAPGARPHLELTISAYWS